MSHNLCLCLLWCTLGLVVCFKQQGLQVFRPISQCLVSQPTLQPRAYFLLICPRCPFYLLLLRLLFSFLPLSFSPISFSVSNGIFSSSFHSFHSFHFLHSFLYILSFHFFLVSLSSSLYLCYSTVTCKVFIV